MKKKSILLLLPFAAMALAGCGDKPTPPNQCDSAVVVLNKTAISLEVGASETLTASMSVEECDLGDVTWSSDHPEIAKVENGKVTGVSAGTAVISANGALCTVTVTPKIDPPGPKTDYGTEDNPLTVAKALAIMTEECANDGDLTKQAITAEGVITSVDNSFNYESGPAFELHVGDGENELYVYRVHTTAEQKENVAVGSTIKFVGFAKNFKGTLEFFDSDEAQCTALSVTKNEKTVKTLESLVAGYPTEIYLNETIDPAKVKINVVYSDDSKGVLQAESVVVDSSAVGTVKAKAYIGEAFLEFDVSIKDPAEDSIVGKTMVQVNDNSEIEEGLHAIVANGPTSGLVFNGADVANDYVAADVSTKSFVGADGMSAIKVTAMEGGFSLQVLGGTNHGKYMAGVSGKNALSFSDTPVLNTIAINAEGVATIVSNGSTLAFNTAEDQMRFRYYKAGSSVLESGYPVSLYKVGTPVPVELVSITADMTKKSYTEGEALDLSGLVVTGHYSDESEAEITSGYDLSMTAGQILTTEDEAVVVTYEELTCSIPLTVREASITLESISLSGVKTSYYAGEKLGEVVVTAHYSDESSEPVTAELKIGENVVDADHVMALEEEQLIASYEGKTVTADFVVLEDTVERIAVSEEHRTFELGAEFVKETVTATYASGKTEDVTEDSSFTGYDKETAGEQTITVTYGTLEPITYLITVSAPAPIVAEGTYTIKHIKSETPYYMVDPNAAKSPTVTTDIKEAAVFDFILEENSLCDYKIKVHGENKYLSCNDANDGVRIGSSAAVWTITKGTQASGAYDIYTNVGSAETPKLRYLTVYNTQDFRAYTSPKTNRTENTDLEAVVVKDVESIAIKQNPTKMSYYVGEAFDPTGMIVTVTYTDKTTEDITEGFTYEGSTGFQVANPDRTVKVTYKTKNAYVQHVEVKEDDRTITAIKFAEGCDMTKKEYEVGDDWNPKGLKVIAVRSDDSEIELADSDVTFTYDKTTEAAAESMTLNVTAHYKVDDSTTLDSAAKAITVVVKEKEAPVGGTVTASYPKDKGTTNMTADAEANAEAIGLDSNLFNVVASKNTGSGNLCGLNNAGYMALYCNKNTSDGGSIEFIIDSDYVIDSIVISWKQNDQYAKVTDASGSVVTAVNNVYTINGSSFKIQDIANQSSSTQVHIYSIEITYSVKA